MDPITMTGANILIYDNQIPPAPYGTAPTIIHLGGSNQTIVITNTSLANPGGPAPAGQYVITTNGGTKSLTGVNSIPLEVEGFFTVTTAATTVPVVFGTPVATQGASGIIDLTFDLATVSAVTMTGNYDVYLSNTAGGENMLAAPVTRTSTQVAADAATAGLLLGKGRISFSGLTLGNTYYYLVVAKDTATGNVLPTPEISAIAP